MNSDAMIKKPGILKRNGLGVKAETISKVAAQIAAAESATINESELRQVALSNIQLWENQPRTFYLKIEDIYRGYVLKDDPDYETKTDELERLISLAYSIVEFGLLNPPIAYALPGKNVQLMAGQRRTMAVVFALFHIKTTIDQNENKQHDVSINENPDLSLLEHEKITIKVHLKKPDDLTKERLGIIDNVQRVDLPIGDKLSWLMKFSDQLEGIGKEVRWRDLVDTLALSRSQAYEWISIVHNRKDRFVKKLIEMVIYGECTFGKLLEIVKTEAEAREDLYAKWFSDKSRPVPDTKTKISLGKTDNTNAIKMLVLSNVDDEYKKKFESVEWSNAKLAKKGFADFLEYWIKKHG